MAFNRQLDFPWQKEYFVFGIPKSLKPYPDVPAFQILESTAKKYPNRGLIQQGCTMHYPEVLDKSYRLATALYRFGLKKSDRVATLLPTSIPFVIADHAISRAGLVHVPCSALEPVNKLSFKLTDSSPKALICLDEDIDIAMKLSKKCNIPYIIVTRLSDYSDTPEKTAPNLPNSHTFWLSDLLKNTPLAPPDITIDSDLDLEMILFTGGTTGVPKGCMLTHKNIYANTIQNAWAMGASHKATKGCLSVLLGLPFFHSYGHIVMHTMTYLGFNQILIPDARDTKMMVKLIKSYSPLLQMGVPTQFMNLAKHELNGIGIIGVSGSAPLPPSTQNDFEKSSGGALMEGYGLTEMSPATHLNTSLLLRIAGGRLPQQIMSLILKTPGLTFCLNKLIRLIGTKATGYIAGKGLLFILKRRSAKIDQKDAIEKGGPAASPFRIRMFG